jgi:hypothetical protein
MMGLSTAIYAYTEPRTAPLTPVEIQVKGKARSKEKACERMKIKQRKKYERLCKR